MLSGLSQWRRSKVCKNSLCCRIMSWHLTRSALASPSFNVSISLVLKQRRSWGQTQLQGKFSALKQTLHTCRISLCFTVASARKRGEDLKLATYLCTVEVNACFVHMPLYHAEPTPLLWGGKVEFCEMIGTQHPTLHLAGHKIKAIPCDRCCFFLCVLFSHSFDMDKSWSSLLGCNVEGKLLQLKKSACLVKMLYSPALASAACFCGLQSQMISHWRHGQN